VLQPDGSRQRVDIRTLPFVRFDDNEAHCQRRHSLNLGGGAPFGPPNVAGVGPDPKHPFIVRGTKLWNVHWGINPISPSVLIDGMLIHNAEYGVWRPEYKDHYYRSIAFSDVPEKNLYAVANGKPNDESKFPDRAKIADDEPPMTVVTFVGSLKNGKRLLRGTTSDKKLTAQATDAAGNIEKRPHVISLP